MTADKWWVVDVGKVKMARLRNLQEVGNLKSRCVQVETLIHLIHLDTGCGSCKLHYSMLR